MPALQARTVYRTCTSATRRAAPLPMGVGLPTSSSGLTQGNAPTWVLLTPFLAVEQAVRKSPATAIQRSALAQPQALAISVSPPPSAQARSSTAAIPSSWGAPPTPSSYQVLSQILRTHD